MQLVFSLRRGPTSHRGNFYSHGNLFVDYVCVHLYRKAWNQHSVVSSWSQPRPSAHHKFNVWFEYAHVWLNNEMQIRNAIAVFSVQWRKPRKFSFLWKLHFVYTKNAGLVQVCSVFCSVKKSRGLSFLWKHSVYAKNSELI